MWKNMTERFSIAERTVPNIVTERVDGVNIGRTTLAVVTLPRWEPNADVISLINVLNGNSPNSETRRGKIRVSLNNNTPNDSQSIEHKRAVSAYFTYNPNDETVIIEWGTINLNSEAAKLHTYLNRMINYAERKERGMKLSSGHLARTKSGLHIALFDSLFYSHAERTDPNSPIGKTINTLYSNNFVPITADGFVQLPAF